MAGAGGRGGGGRRGTRPTRPRPSGSRRAQVIDYATALASGGRWVLCYYDAVSGETCWDPDGADGGPAPAPAPAAPDTPPEVPEALERHECFYDPRTERMHWSRDECSAPEEAIPCWYDATSEAIEWATGEDPSPRHASLDAKMESLAAQLLRMESQLRARGIVSEVC